MLRVCQHRRHPDYQAEATASVELGTADLKAQSTNRGDLVTVVATTTSAIGTSGGRIANQTDTPRQAGLVLYPSCHKAKEADEGPAVVCQALPNYCGTVTCKGTKFPS